jgi:two-component system response regulator RegA
MNEVRSQAAPVSSDRQGALPLPSILVVDDDEIFRSRLVAALERRGFDTRAAGSYEQALALAQGDSPEYALVDLNLPGRSGLDIVRALKEIDAATRIVVLTGYGSIATAMQAVRLGAAHYISKPADVDDILAAFERDPDAASASSSTSFATPSLARVEWEHINRVLADCGGNVSEAARLLKIHRRSLQRKLRKYPPKE